MVSTGFSLSPGGLMLPYHVGALAALEYHGLLDNTIPLAGSSAGAIAAAAHSCGIKPERVLEASIDVSEKCAALGGARGRLLPFVASLMTEIIHEEDFNQLTARPALTGICYRELFPRNRAVLKTNFDDKRDMIQAVSNSCMFPFFSTNWPCAVDASGSSPRLVVDGFFAVSRERFGCPEFEMAGLTVHRTISISVFPREKIRLTAPLDPRDQICPAEDVDFGRLIAIATQPTSREDLVYAYELGWQNAQEFAFREQSREV
jgi:hypothetical protein